jgi:energy-coupling factor transporter ATP-binding protein EcfA2
MESQLIRTNEIEPNNPMSISAIKVDELFGYYTYRIPQQHEINISQLLILYGDNGSGKTTVLKLVFWLLSCRDKSGFKSKIAKTKFRNFSVHFRNGIEVGASRLDGSIIGGFTYYVKSAGGQDMSLQIDADENHEVNFKNGTSENEKYLQMLKFIHDTKMTVFYLTDDREIFNSRTSSLHDPKRYKRKAFVQERLVLGDGQSTQIQPEEINSLDVAVLKLIEWIRTKVISGSKTGDKNSQVIFTDLITKIIETQESNESASTKDQLIDIIKSVAAQIIPFVKLGLIEPFDSVSLIDSVKRSKNTSQLKSLRVLIIPYLDSINAKLKAQEALKDTLILLLSSINSYFTSKSIDFNLSSGFYLAYKDGIPLQFSQLSSGEKQLMLLFINTITSAEEATVFLIDEPEISLNIKWQRKLVKTLLQFSERKNIQYVFCTHSLELLSSNLEHVTKLGEKDA